MQAVKVFPWKFQSTLPIQGATWLVPGKGSCMKFQSTLPIQGATALFYILGGIIHISIHAPHTGSDEMDEPIDNMTFDFNPRSPYRERRIRSRRSKSKTDYFNPRSPYRERPLFSIELLLLIISIHAPHTGSDKIQDHWLYQEERFQSTLPIQGATMSLGLYMTIMAISIHAPHTGSDERLMA